MTKNPSHYSSSSSNELVDIKNAYFLLLSSFIVNVGFGLAIPLFTALGNKIDIGNIGFTSISPGFAIGILLSIFMVVRMLTSYFVPGITDKVGRKNILILGLIIYGITTLLIGFARDFWLLFLLRGSEGAAVGIAFPTSEALLVDSVPQKTRGAWMGKFFITFNAGFAIGPAMGSFMYGFANFSLKMNEIDAFLIPYGITGILGLFSAVVVYFFVHDMYVPEKAPKKQINPTIKQSLKVSKSEYKIPFLSRLYSISLINGFGIGLIVPILSLYALNEFQIPVDSLGYMFMIAGLTALPINWVSGRLSDNHNRVLMALLGMSVGTLAFVGLGLFSSFVFVILFFIIRFMSMMFFVPAYRAFQADIIPPKVRGKYFGRVQAVFNLGAASAPLIGGVMYDSLSGQSYQLIQGFTILGAGLIFEFCALVSLLSTFFIYLIYRVYNPDIHSYRHEKTQSLLDPPAEPTGNY